MYLFIILIFALGYLAIAMEHSLKINKAASALFLGVIIWTLLVFGGTDLIGDRNFSPEWLDHQLFEHLGEISGILFFLLGAMTIVELIDMHNGFEIITSKITTTDKRKLLWILGFVTFFMSAVLDNLTTSIVMAALLKKLLNDKNDIWIFASIVILAANAGGAWSPIGDVTTIMLWIGGQVTAMNIIIKLLIPSLICVLIPLLFLSKKVNGNITPKQLADSHHQVATSEKNAVFIIGVGALLFVPIFKTITHLPPFMGILLGLSVLWVYTELIHKNKEVKIKESLSIVKVLEKIDTSSILFFLGILMAVAGLQTSGHLNDLAGLLNDKVGNIWAINTLVGVFSAVVDNVPLVAGSIGMYTLDIYPQNDLFWELLAFCAGTGGSILIIGSAAGVAVMGIFHIDFIWYLKNIALYAFLGFIAGIITFYFWSNFLAMVM